MERTIEPTGSLLYELLNAAIALTEAQMGNVQLLDRGRLTIVAYKGFSRPFLEFFDSVESGHAACGEAMRHRAQVVVEDVTSHPIFMGTRALEEVLAAGVRAVQSTPIVSSKGALLGMLSTHFREPHRPDNHQLRMLEYLARAAGASIERDAEFLTTVVKELRNPLAAIRNRVDVLKGTGDERHVHNSTLGTFDRQLGHMVHFVDDLMNLTRLNLNRIELRMARVDVAGVVRESVEGQRSLMEGMGYEVSFDSMGQSIQVDADVMRLMHLVGNLVFNAAKSMAEGGRIMVTVERAGGQAVIRVQDRGVGFDAGEANRLFKIFTTQPECSRRRFSSELGVGLALVKSIVDMHGGAIDARSDGIGRGSEFIVYLPIAKEPPETVAAA